MKQPADLLETIANGLTKSPDDRPRVQWLMDELTWELRGLRRGMKSDDWKSFVGACRSHRLRDLVHSDPFTNWSFSRPRGYPGDASLLDFIYGFFRNCRGLFDWPRRGFSGGAHAAGLVGNRFAAAGRAYSCGRSESVMRGDRRHGEIGLESRRGHQGKESTLARPKPAGRGA